MDNPASILFDANGVPIDTATQTPASDAKGLVVRMPEVADLKDGIEILQQYLMVLGGAFQYQPDVAGRIRVLLDGITGSLTLSTLSVLTSMGQSVCHTGHVPSNTSDVGFADAIRRNIIVT